MNCSSGVLHLQLISRLVLVPPLFEQCKVRSQKLGVNFPVDLLFLTRTLSQGAIGLSTACRRLSAHIFPASFRFQSRSLIPSSRTLLLGRSSGNLVLSSLPNIRNAGVAPVLL